MTPVHRQDLCHNFYIFTAILQNASFITQLETDHLLKSTDWRIMGATFSRARKGRGQSSDNHLISASTIPPFLDLPLDVLHCIFDHIEPGGDAVAYTISCKTLYDNYFAKALKQLRVATPIQKQAVHLMLEKERPDTFYCHSCDALHCYDRQWRATGTFPCHAIVEDGNEPVWTTLRLPQGEPYYRTMRLSGGYDHYGHRLRYPYKAQSSTPMLREEFECFLCPWGARGECPHAFCKLSSEFQPQGWNPHMPYRVDYVVARLVMNRHLLGAHAGLPLEALEVRDYRRTTPYDLRPEPFVWTQTWRAKIIKDELFLSAEHRYIQPAVDDEFARRMRSALTLSDDYRGKLTESPASSIGICAHVSDEHALQWYLPYLDKRGPGSFIRDLFVPCSTLR